MLDLQIILDSVEEIEVNRVRREVYDLKNEIIHVKDVYYDPINCMVVFSDVNKVPVELVEKVYQRKIEEILKDN